MEIRSFGSLGQVSALTLGGGGIGQVWGPTSRQEAVATVKAAVDLGITFLDVAPGYGNGEAELVVGEAFGGQLPDGVRLSTKCRLGNPPADQAFSLLEQSLEESLARMKLDRVDLFFLHGDLLPGSTTNETNGTPRSLFVESVLPAFERLLSSGRIGAWGITGIGVPEAVIETIEAQPKPAAVQAIANLLDSPGALKRYEGPARPREIIAAAKRRGVGVMGIRVVQAGALTQGLDRELPEGHRDLADYHRAAAFRELAKELGESPAVLAHRYALSMEGVSTVILGVKNRDELRQCVDAEAMGPLAVEVIKGIDDAAGRTP